MVQGHHYSVSLRSRGRNYFAAATSCENMFCALAVIALASAMEKQDSSSMLPATFQPMGPQTRKHAMDSSDQAEWLDAEQRDRDYPNENQVLIESVLPKGRKSAEYLCFPIQSS